MHFVVDNVMFSDFLKKEGFRIICVDSDGSAELSLSLPGIEPMHQVTSPLVELANTGGGFSQDTGQDTSSVEQPCLVYKAEVGPSANRARLYEVMESLRGNIGY
jgi:hypothetical protein